jgi:hypothetical protein
VHRDRRGSVSMWHGWARLGAQGRCRSGAAQMGNAAAPRNPIADLPRRLARRSECSGLGCPVRALHVPLPSPAPPAAAAAAAPLRGVVPPNPAPFRSRPPTAPLPGSPLPDPTLPGRPIPRPIPSRTHLQPCPFQVARFPDDEDEEMLAAYRAGGGVDCVGGAEAIISHLVTRLAHLMPHPHTSPRTSPHTSPHTSSRTSSPGSWGCPARTLRRCRRSRSSPSLRRARALRSWATPSYRAPARPNAPPPWLTAQARLLRRLRARLAAPGGSTLPEGEARPLGLQPRPRVLEPANRPYDRHHRP